MRRIGAMLSLLVSTSLCLASGWNDFIQDIGDGHSVSRCNSMDVCIGRTDGPLVLYPDAYNVGPVTGYIVTSECILAKTYGRKPRSAFDGDRYREVDASKEYFFVIAKGTDEVRGPFSEEEFSQQPVVLSLGQLTWEAPHPSGPVPQQEWPLIACAMGWAILALFLATEFLWITIPTIAGAVLLFICVRKRLRSRPQPMRAG